MNKNVGNPIFETFLQSLLNYKFIQKDLIRQCIEEDLLLTCKCLIYVNCKLKLNNPIVYNIIKEMMFDLSGKSFAKKFFSSWNDQTKKGGFILNTKEIYSIYIVCEGKLTNAMKKGFAKAIESFSAEQLIQEQHFLRNIIKLIHPNPAKSEAFIMYEGKEQYVIDLISKGIELDVISVNKPSEKQPINSLTIREHLEQVENLNL